MSAKYYHGADDGKYKKMGELRLRCSPCADFELRLMCNHVGCIGLHWNPEPLLKTFDVDRVGFVRLGRSAAMREALARARPPVRALERATTLAIRAAPRAAVADGPAAADPLLILSKETIVLDALRAKGKCLLLFSNDVLGRITVGSEVIVGRSGVWYDGVVRKLPGRRKSCAFSIVRRAAVISLTPLRWSSVTRTMRRVASRQAPAATNGRGHAWPNTLHARTLRVASASRHTKLRSDTRA